MRTQSEIERFARNKYREYLRQVLAGEPWKRLPIPFGKLDPAASLPHLMEAVRELVGGSKAVIGHGYTVELVETPTRKHGVQSLPQSAVFTTEEDYLRYVGKTKDALLFRRNVALAREAIPGIEPWMGKNLGWMEECAQVWPELVRVCAWFVANPRPNCFMREIRVGVHTKFIEQHQAVINSMLLVLLPDHHDPFAEDFPSRFFLRDKEPMVRLRLVDPELRELTGVRLTDFAVPIGEFHRLPFADVPRVVVIENEVTFLTFGPMPGVVLVCGMGNGVHRIAEAPWLRGGERTLYWGDVDTMGVTILGWLRRRLPRIRSVLMDVRTLSAFPEAEVEDKSSAVAQLDPEFLTTDERHCYLTVTAKAPRRRLEQELIPASYAQAAIADAFAQ
jgi:hypothetical protein